MEAAIDLSDYEALWNSCEVSADLKRQRALEYVSRIAVQNQIVYQAVQLATGVPWALIAAIHYRECDQDFFCHLHNGDPLQQRTTHVPAGRPVKGIPPFTWGESAADAMTMAWKPASWSIQTALEFVERYNGLGYRKHGIRSPYLWGSTNLYSCGLYTSDGKFSAAAVDIRPGAAAILKAIAARGVPLGFSLTADPTSLN